MQRVERGGEKHTYEILIFSGAPHAIRFSPTAKRLTNDFGFSTLLVVRDASTKLIALEINVPSLPHPSFVRHFYCYTLRFIWHSSDELRGIVTSVVENKRIRHLVFFFFH